MLCQFPIAYSILINVNNTLMLLSRGSYPGVEGSRAHQLRTCALKSIRIAF